MRRALILASCLSLAACGESVRDDHFANDVKEERADASVTASAAAVRVGELGPNFPACAATGTTRNVGAEGLALREAPFDNAKETGRVAAGARFFVCARSHDQKWFGIIFDEAGASAACGVAGPLPRRRDYDGPCRSGWVSSPFVRLSGALGDGDSQPNKAAPTP